MVQEILALTIVFSAFGYTVFSAVKTITTKKKSGCGTGCSCSAKKEFKNILLKNGKTLKKGKFVMQ